MERSLESYHSSDRRRNNNKTEKISGRNVRDFVKNFIAVAFELSDKSLAGIQWNSKKIDKANNINLANHLYGRAFEGKNLIDLSITGLLLITIYIYIVLFVNLNFQSMTLK